ncbi:MAG: MFS transporter [Burkholderiales bacterium]|nr:MFS transporter [Burkholderiales bacterium]
MKSSKNLYVFILSLLISYGSIGAVCFTPGLPKIAEYFAVNDQVAEFTISWYLLGYAIGQLIYGPLVNRFGNKNTIVFAALLAILGCVGSIVSYYTKSFDLLLLSRVIMALGAASGLKMTFTLSSKLFDVKDSARVLGLLTMAFAITPGLGVFLGGILVNSYGWVAPFYLMIFYSLAIIYLNRFLPMVYKADQSIKFSIVEILRNYMHQIKDSNVIIGGALLGMGSCFVYVFATLSPFIAIKIMGLKPQDYGMYNFIPSIGILLGSLSSNYVGQKYTPKLSLKLGVLITTLGTLILFACMSLHNAPLYMFVPMIMVYYGLSFIFGNSAALALHQVKDTSNASAVMSFINMGSAVVAVMILTNFAITQSLVLPVIYVILSIITITLCSVLILKRK